LLSSGAVCKFGNRESPHRIHTVITNMLYIESSGDTVIDILRQPRINIFRNVGITLI
jgi:hypothetical protein